MKEISTINFYNIYQKEMNTKRAIPASTAFVPSVAGLIICSEVIRDLTK